MAYSRTWNEVDKKVGLQRKTLERIDEHKHMFTVKGSATWEQVLREGIKTLEMRT